MAINTTKRKAGPYHGDGMSVYFPFEFRVFEAPDLRVIYTDESGAEQTLTLNADYTVTLNKDQETLPGGNIVLKKALQNSSALTITSAMAYLQPTKLTNHGGFYPTVINDALDRLTIFVQQLEEQVDRAVKVTISSELNPNELVNSIYDSASAAKQSADAAKGSEESSKEHADIAQNAADRLEGGLFDLLDYKNAIKPATFEDIQGGVSGKLVDAAGLRENLRTPGEVGMFCFATPPLGWLLANGAQVSRTTYARLFAAIGTTFGVGDGSTTFNLPDLRGEFIRGLDFDRNVDPERTLGSAQGDAIRNITGGFAYITSAGGNTGFYGAISVSTSTTKVNGISVLANGANSQTIFDASLVVPTAHENRPRNIALAMFVFAGI